MDCATNDTCPICGEEDTTNITASSSSASVLVADSRGAAGAVGEGEGIAAAGGVSPSRNSYEANEHDAQDGDKPTGEDGKDDVPPAGGGGGEAECCLVCHKDIDTRRDCGLRLPCGHWQCERCSMILAEHCSICHRSVINISVPCLTCQEPTVMYQSRCCIVCQVLCCEKCSVPTRCCQWSNLDDERCVHVRCSIECTTCSD